MKTTRLMHATLGLSLLAACGQQAPTTSERTPGLGFEIAVAPLTLPGIDEATYKLTVKNAGGETVWTRDSLASTDYGNGQGALTYIGPCDADGGLHTVELVLLSLSDSANGVLSSPGDYANPTLIDGVETPIVVTGVVCDENADTRVPINLTVMRAARQGFFDMAVEFDDIFCSAKLDCRDSFLHNAEGERSETAIVGFACTAGTGGDTYLYMSDVTLSCTDEGGTETTTVDLSAVSALGNQGAPGTGIYQWGVYQGEEQLGDGAFDKCYWNNALGLDVAALAGKSCTVSAQGTASDEPFERDGDTYIVPQTGSYPFVNWEVEVHSADGSLCDNQALGESDHVSVEYVLTGTEVLPALSAEMRCGAPQATCRPGVGDVVASGTDSGFTLAMTGIGATSFTLPEGYVMSSSCCTPECCQ